MMPGSEKYCWPCLGIIANVGNDPGNVNRESEYWMRKFSDFKPIKFGVFLNENQCIEHVVVSFKSDWSGFKNGIEFEKSFEARGKGREGLTLRKTCPGSRLYGWVAREDDYASDGQLGEYLRSKVALKTVPELIQEANANRGKILCELMNEMNLINKNLDQVRVNYVQNRLSVVEMRREQDKMRRSFDEAIVKLQCIAREHITGVLEEQKMFKFDMEWRRQRLDSQRKDLSKREEALDEREGRILDVEKIMIEVRKSKEALAEREKQIVKLENIKRDLTHNMLQMTAEDRRKSDENARELIEVQKREKDAVKKVLELERDLGEKRREIEELKDQIDGLKIVSQDLLVKERLYNNECKELMNREKEAVEKVIALERELAEKQLGIEELKDQMNDLTVKERRTHDELQEAIEKILDLELKLDVKHKLEVENEELKDQMNDLQSFNQDLIVKERQCNDELQGSRKELMEGLSGMSVTNGRRAKIGIKLMGEIDPKAFKKTCNQRYPPEDAEIIALQLCSLWQEKLKNPQWHPFRVAENSIGVPQSLLKEDDELLQGLKAEWGEEIYDAVVTALKEIHEYNPSGCYLVAEFWNFLENRKATLKEAIGHICKRLKTLKRKRY